MQFSSSKRFFSGCLAALQMMVAVVSVAPVSTWAQAVDSEPPVIDYQPVEEGIAGDGQVFTASVSDNQGVRSVILHYRLDAVGPYESRDMQLLSGTDIYTTTIETRDAAPGVSAIQYFIEASDNAGNRTHEGFAFVPNERVLLAQPSVIAENPGTPASSTSTPAVGMSTQKKILYGVLGVVAVAALASASSSSSGATSSEEPGVDLTVVVDPLR